ncbi:response regulator transcription factor [Sulfurovum sp. zt1-1]|uniref:Response regulator transcription factor n=1 Tax=Sulfurovum zhangzhouensis TaxID=3019067 RepID=A0ABT7R036_9BACT|nr:response regulator transcription factor [Sulfurovum zhangzhouensis]MDM5272462.1 response regulator transcription factor [Sulfurovum zhangzhouensis]
MNKILLLEDDPNLAKSLIRFLTHENYSVDWAKDGEEALDLTYENKYSLYLLDINVPLINGVDLLTSLREAEDFTPTIIISALIDVNSVTKGFIAGADDYVKKPFDPDELLVRIKAKTASLREKLKVGDLEADLVTEELFNHSQPLYLGDVQKNILLSLMKNHPNPVTKEELMLFLEKPNDLALRVNITKLKKNLGINIQNIRGVGYKVI